ncbi:hypothetical protein [Comamonas sp. 26]|uniref:hypothetical protein n=1 Tax=Comamonas sp. 26 TaxID=2035201 RepID=UPI0011982699|nr:hypothetical protein [Comamonas sp. 26]
MFQIIGKTTCSECKALQNQEHIKPEKIDKRQYFSMLSHFFSLNKAVSDRLLKTTTTESQYISVGYYTANLLDRLL